MVKDGMIAVDLGAESGRVVLGALDDDVLWTEEVHRFTHRQVPTPGGLCWDLTGLWNEILEGLRRAMVAARRVGVTPRSVGCDTWGVDWTLVSPGNTLRGLPRCYRDPAFKAAFDRVTAKIPPAEIYGMTGIQLMSINTLFQFAAGAAIEPERFVNGRLVFMPDLFHWLLSGQVTIERTIASTSQMLDTRSGKWADGLLKKLGLPLGVLIDPVAPGTVIGPLLLSVATAIGCQTPLLVVAPPSHDTASAVAAVPAEPGSNWAYLSSGTWSLLGAELDAPCITEASAAANFTNELGINGTVRFLNNIAGLWLVQQCRRQWDRQGESFEYPHLVRLADKASPFRTLIAANHPSFLAPSNMIEAIQNYARHTDQPVPTSPGEITRCCLESLALEYRRSLMTLSTLLDKTFDVLHVVGGGSKNELLNQMTADAIDLPVCVGPAEATAIGNLLTQAMGLGLIKDLAQLRATVRKTEPPVMVRPRSHAAWAEAIVRHSRLPKS